MNTLNYLIVLILGLTYSVNSFAQSNKSEEDSKKLKAMEETLNRTLAEMDSLRIILDNKTEKLESKLKDINAKSKQKMIFSKLEARVISNSNLVSVGSEYSAEVVLVASGPTSSNSVIVGGRVLPMENGRGIYTARPSNLGVYKWSGIFRVNTKDSVIDYPFEAEYMAINGGATISADIMNVLYIGLDNPISVSVPGYAPNDVVVTITGGTLTKMGNGTYIARVTAIGSATINVSIKMRDGSIRPMGTKQFRIRNVPKPEARFGALESGVYSSVAVSGQNIIIGVMSNFVFEGIKYNVTSYTFSYYPIDGVNKSIPVKGAQITEEIKTIISKAKKGDKILVDEIYADGPDAVGIKVAPVAITIE